MAVTVAFEPKEVRSCSFVLDQDARIQAASSIVISRRDPVQSVSIMFGCNFVGTDSGWSPVGGVMYDDVSDDSASGHL